MDFLAKDPGLGLSFMKRVKQALDPQGIMNPGKIAASDPWSVFRKSGPGFPSENATKLGI
jgi:hypothetical protein